MKSSVQAVPTCDWGAAAGLVLKIEKLFVAFKTKALWGTQNK